MCAVVNLRLKINKFNTLDIYEANFLSDLCPYGKHNRENFYFNFQYDLFVGLYKKQDSKFVSTNNM